MCQKAQMGRNSVKNLNVPHLFKILLLFLKILYSSLKSNLVKGNGSGGKGVNNKYATKTTMVKSYE